MSCPGGAGPSATVFLIQKACQLRATHQSLASKPLFCPPACIYIYLYPSCVSLQQQVICMSPKMNQLGYNRSCNDTATGQTGLTDFITIVIPSKLTCTEKN